MSAKRQQRTRAQRQQIIRNRVAKVKWSDHRFSIIVACVDPCYELQEFHTNSKADALTQWDSWARYYDARGGEWSVRLFEHPSSGKKRRKNMVRKPENFVYEVEFPDSKVLKRHDYMQPRLKPLSRT